MARPLSNDLRERVVARHEAGASIRAVAEMFGIAPSTVSKWSARRRRTGSVAPARRGAKPPETLVARPDANQNRRRLRPWRAASRV